ncbi:MAG: lipoyl synthase [Planctomycetes bacterium]|nr:lipoyl synthase [Planctomycetota bacterium]
MNASLTTTHASKGVTRLPPWLKKRLIPGGSTSRVARALEEYRLKTVCREASCPNTMECFAAGTATFIVLGDTCTRNCGFCGVKKGLPRDIVDTGDINVVRGVEDNEPQRLAGAVRSLGLRHVVVTSVTRDDLPDGGSGHFSRVVHALRGCKDLGIEVLVPDFGGVLEDVRRVVEAGPDVFSHNVETVPRLYPVVRPEARYKRTLHVLEFAGKTCKNNSGNMRIKSGLMLGLGEKREEVLEALRDLVRVGCQMITIGQYLRPSRDQLPVERFVTPEEFKDYAEAARALGFSEVLSGPFVRSSYRLV